MPNTLEDIENAFSQYAILRLKNKRKEDARSKATQGLAFSAYLISQIRSFEHDMDALQRCEFDYHAQIDIFKTMKKMYCQSENPAVKTKQLSLLLTDRICQAKKKQKKKDDFHDLVFRFYHPKDAKDKIKTATALYKKVGEHILGDLPPYIKGGRPRVYAELKSELAGILNELYLQNAVNAQQFGSQEKDFRSAAADCQAAKQTQEKIIAKALDLSTYTEHQAGHPFGPQGAFSKGGIYGPDSSFAGLNLTPTKTNTLPSSVAGTAQQVPQKSQAEIFTQLKLFSDKHFDY